MNSLWVQNGELYVTPEYGSECGVKCGFKIWCYGCMLSLIFRRGPKRGHLKRFKWGFIWPRLLIPLHYSRACSPNDKLMLLLQLLKKHDCWVWYKNGIERIKRMIWINCCECYCKCYWTNWMIVLNLIIDISS